MVFLEDVQRVSIPDWCDWQGVVTSSTLKSFDVSIPDWCDWQKPPARKGYGRLQFQFQIGAIGSILPEIKMFLDPPFQFQIGAIGRVQEKQLTE